MKKKIITGSFILIVIAGVILGFTAFKPAKNNATIYKTEKVDKGDIEALVVTTGSLNPVTIVDIGSQVSGMVEEIYVDFNTEVKEGQVIAKIEQSSFLARVQQNEANYKSGIASLEKAKVTLENIKKKTDRSLELFEKKLISYEEKESAEAQYFSARSDVQSAEAKLEQARSQLDSSKVDLAYTIIKSPIDGIVINRKVNPGQTVAASFQAPVLFQIANDLSKMQVECSVDEADIGKINEGQIVKFTVDAFPDESFTGTVSQVRYFPEVIQNVVTYTTIVEVENPEMKLRPGMTATVSIVIGEAKNKLLVPNAALRFTPQLSIEEMQAIFEDMRNERQGANTDPTSEAGQSVRKQRPNSVVQSSSKKEAGAEGPRMENGRNQDVSRVWIMDKNGVLKAIIIDIGITDNSYTEVVKGNLMGGQLVITGIASGKENSESSRSNDSMRGMIRAFR